MSGPGRVGPARRLPSAGAPDAGQSRHAIRVDGDPLYSSSLLWAIQCPGESPSGPVQLSLSMRSDRGDRRAVRESAPEIGRPTPTGVPNHGAEPTYRLLPRVDRQVYIPCSWIAGGGPNLVPTGNLICEPPAADRRFQTVLRPSVYWPLEADFEFSQQR